MTNRTPEEIALLELADRIESADDFSCPLCGDDGFDAPGISMHWFRWCEVNRAVEMARDNAEVAQNLRALAVRSHLESHKP